MALEAGRKIGHYEVIAPVGSGGMGEVYRARDTKLGREVAIKILPSDVAREPTRRERFEREAQSVAALNHPNVVTVYSVEEIDGMPLITMELVDGQSLAESATSDINLDELLRIGVDIADALRAAHERGIIHRDLKPANVMVSRDGRVKLLDFGLAKVDEAPVHDSDPTRPRDLTQDGAIMGTVPYMSPEQLKGLPVGPPADLFALGVMLYELASGRHPFRGDSQVETIAAILKETPEALTSVSGSLPSGLAELIEHCLEKNPEVRPASARVVRDRLNELHRDRAWGGGSDTAPTATDRAARTIGFPARLLRPDTDLVGRDDALAEIVARIDDHRVVTVSGPGGVGKTRLAVESCRSLRPRFDGGIVFVSMDSLARADAFLPRLADILDVKEAATRTLRAGIIEHIGQRHVLFMLDNMEGVLDAALDVAALLDDCPGLRCLVTSRAPLRISGEYDLSLPPLTLPPGNGDRAVSLEEVREAPAVALFVDAASRARRGFRLTQDNLGDVLDICRRLDGLPLALKLAAARLRLLTPGALARRLENALDLLSGGSRDRPERHQTLRATIDWSYSLLRSGEKELFRRMSVFERGASLEALEATCSGDEARALDALDALVDQGLVQIDPSGERFNMLQTIKEFAHEQLEAAGETKELEERHAKTMLDFTERLRDGVEGGDQVGWVEHGLVEEENVSVALDRLLARARAGDADAAETGLRICGHVWLYWHIRGKNISLRDIADGFLACEGEHDTIGRAGALLSLGLGHHILGDIDRGNAVWLEAERTAGRLSAGREQTRAAICLTLGLIGSDTDAALEWGRKAEELGKELDYSWGIALAQCFQGHVRHARGEPDAARNCFERALTRQRSIGDAEGTGASLSGLGQLAVSAEDFETAASLFAESLESFESIGDRAEMARVNTESGWAALRAGDVQAARAHFHEGIRLHQDIASLRGVGLSLLGLAAVEQVEGRPSQAAQIATVASRLADAEGSVVVYGEGHPGEPYLKAARDALDEASLAKAEAAGRTMDVAEATAIAR